MKPLRTHALSVILGTLCTLPCFGQWDNISLGVPETIFDAHFLTPSTGFAVGWGAERGVLGRTTDGGASWEIESIPGTYLFSIKFADELNGVITGHDQSCTCALIRNTTDGGKTWSDENTYQGSFGIYEVEFADRTTGYGGGYNGAILKTTDAGKSWTPTPTGTGDVFVMVAAPHPDTAYAVAGEGQNFFAPDKLYRSVDGGASWQVIQEYAGILTVSSIDFMNAREGIMLVYDAEGPSNRVLKTTDAGETWRTILTSTNATHTLGAVDMTPDGQGLAVGSASTMAWTTDGGENWSIEYLTPEIDFTNAIVQDGFFYAVGYPGIVARKSAPVAGVEDDGGRTAAASITSLGNGAFLFSLEKETRASLTLYDGLGRIAATGTYDGSPLTLDLHSLPSGIYLYRFTSEGEAITGKFVIP